MSGQRGKNKGGGYIKGKGVLVGTFNEQDIAVGRYKRLVERAKKETGYQYLNCETVMVGGVSVARLYVCKAEDVKGW